MVALWDAFYIENKRFELDTLRVPSRSPTPISKTSDFPGPLDHILGAPGPHVRPILGVPGARAGPATTYCLAFEAATTIFRPRSCWSPGRLQDIIRAGVVDISSARKWCRNVS